MNMRKIVLTLAGIGVVCTIVGALLLSGSFGYLPGEQRRVPVPGVVINQEKYFPVGQVQAISMHTVSSTIRWHVTSGDQIRVHLHGNAAGNPPELLAAVNGGRLDIEVHHKPPMVIYQGMSSVDLDVYVPAKVLESLFIETVSGDTEFPTVQAREFSFKSVSGDLTAGGIEAGQSRLATTSGNIEIGNLGGNLEVKTITGDLNLAYARLAGNQISAETTSGDVRLDLPAGAGFTLEATSVSGDITSDFPISVSGSRGSHSLRGTTGTGENEVKVHTISGDVRVF